MIEVIITWEQKEKAKAEGLKSPAHLLAKLFKEEHGLDFKPEEFMDESKFAFYEADDSTAYKVVYIGQKPN